ncbi:MAG TPA: hypothetical protein PLB52_01590 [Candidatus Moranbacteria bacterium]|nr:hypothetical protein [Candidatus Moranbacteria bacterium]
MENVFGFFTLILAVSMVLVALPSQIIKNHRERKSGLSFLMTALPLSVYVVRACYAVTIKSWWILAPDTLGVFFSIILVFQYFKKYEE